MRHRCDQLMICRNDYFKPPLAMACLAEKGVYKECTFLKILISICQIPIFNDENHALNIDDDWISLTSSEIKLID